MGSDYSNNMDPYSLLNIITNPDFKIFVKSHEVAKNIASYLNSLGTNVNISKKCPVTNAANILCKKYKGKKLNKEKFIKKERDWLAKPSFTPLIMSEDDSNVSVPEEPCLSSSPPPTLPSLPEDAMLPSLSDTLTSISTDSYAEMGVEMMTKEKIALSTNDMFKDSLIYCTDWMISFPRAMVALIYTS